MAVAIARVWLLVLVGELTARVRLLLRNIAVEALRSGSSEGLLLMMVSCKPALLLLTA